MVFMPCANYPALRVVVVVVVVVVTIAVRRVCITVTSLTASGLLNKLVVDNNFRKNTFIPENKKF